MRSETLHTWIIAPYHSNRQAYWESAEDHDGKVYVIDCHRNHRGPYTGAGELLRQMVPAVYQLYPDHVNAHVIEILAVAPELKSLISVSIETLTSLAIPEERTRFYSRMRTLRIAHGLVDFLKGCIILGVYDHLDLFLENAHAADALDQELIAVLLRRADPQKITVTVGTTADPLPQTLEAALSTYAHQVRLESPLQDEQQVITEIEHMTLQDRTALAEAYIASNCTSDSLPEIIAYRLLDASTCQHMHDAQADKLEQLDQWSLHLGAIPYHCEHGQDPSNRGAKALTRAIDYCVSMGYYEATVDIGYRGRKVIDWEAQEVYLWVFTTRMTISLAALGRPEEAEGLYSEARARSIDPSLHMRAAYATSMLYVRHFSEDRRNYILAKGWINEAIAIATLLLDSKERHFSTAFNLNGLALIEMRLGHPEKALQLVNDGIDLLNRELESGEHMLHRSVLLYNRAQVYASIGELKEALADYTTVIQQDLHYSEYYLDRGNLYRKMNRDQEALADYEDAIRYSPPYPEAYYNRASVLSLLGNDEQALADYNYVLELDPDYVDALINRATMLYEREEFAAARRDVEHGLTLSAENAQLLCVLGLLEMIEEHPEEAHHAFTTALEHDPSLMAAWTNRAILSFEQGDIDAAIADLTQALDLDRNATVLYNRGLAYQSKERWQEAIDDYNQALTLDDTDRQDILYQRGVCYFHAGSHDLAHQDFEEHLKMGDSAYLEEISSLDHTFSSHEALL